MSPKTTPNAASVSAATPCLRLSPPLIGGSLWARPASAALCGGAVPEHPLLALGELLPGAGLVLPDVDAHVDEAAHALQQVDGGARVEVLAERLARHHVHDLEAARPVRLALLRRALAVLRRHDHAARGGCLLLFSLVERHHLSTGALRLGVQDPS